MEGARMNDEARQSEQERRELAQQHAGEVVEGSGRVVTPRRLGQMVSVRLDPGLVDALRELANRGGVTLSDVLRDAATRLLEADQAASRTTTSWRIVSQPMVSTSGVTSENASAAS
jgi:Arc/MetJ-type ribon-helix-helix transcriptional regulator